MNDFKIDIKGLHGVVKERSFDLGPTVKARTYVIEDGFGCSPVVGTARRVTGHWLSDGMRDTISSYDFEYVIKNGKNIFPTKEEYTEVDIAPAPLVEALKPVQALVRRKK